MENRIETILVKGLKAHIVYDTCPINPREEELNLSTFAFFHRDFKNESDIDHNDFNSLDEMQEYIEKNLNSVCLPVYAYIHSGVALNTTGFSCPWDSRQLGFVYVTKEKAREWFGWKAISPKRKKQLLGYLEADIDTYNKYINGEVYGYEIIDKDDEHVDSCYGYYDKDECSNNAIASAKYFAQLELDKVPA